jgi:glycosyltransferase involved in cell wall biosynthesis
MISITIVIPVYNGQNTLPRLCRSIERQTKAPAEVIFVEDTSTDKSRPWLEKAVESHPTWKLLPNLKNLGLSESRNRGMQQAGGSHILFMDADDWIDPNLIEKVSYWIEQYQPDVLTFGAAEDFLNKEGRVTYSAEHAPDFAAADREEPGKLADMICMLEVKTLYGYAWNKIYRLDFLRKISLLFKRSHS